MTVTIKIINKPKLSSFIFSLILLYIEHRNNYLHYTSGILKIFLTHHFYSLKWLKQRKIDISEKLIYILWV